MSFSLMTIAQASGGEIRRSSSKPKISVREETKQHNNTTPTKQVNLSYEPTIPRVKKDQESYSLSTSKVCYEQAKKLRMEGYGRQAIDLYLKANRIGESPYKTWSLHQIGCIYYMGLGGVKSNYFEAYRYFKMASDLGFLPSTYYLGVCYEYGRGVGKDVAKANYYYTKSGYNKAPGYDF